MNLFENISELSIKCCRSRNLTVQAVTVFDEHIILQHDSAFGNLRAAVCVFVQSALCRNVVRRLS